jgi:EmrB/QacA subfamily drug resistance transporter
MTATNSASGQRQKPQLILFNVCLGHFMAGLDARVLLVALPTLTSIFQTNLTTIQWTLLAYNLALIGLVLTFGRIGDLFGHGPIYGGGFLTFTIGSALCGLAQAPAQLIAFRIIQGIGGAMITANGRAIVSLIFPEEQRGKALGITSMAFHVGFLTGPTLGGFLIDTVGWRWIFYINVPVGLLGTYLAWNRLQEQREAKPKASMDITGAFFLLTTSVSLLYAMNQLPHLGVRHPVILAFAGLALLTLFLFVRTELRAPAPILSLSLFRNRLFTAANLSLFFITSTQAAIQFLLPFYLQNIMGFTPTQMGWIIIANSVVIVMVAPLAGWISDRLGSRLLCAVGATLIVLAQFFIASLTLDSTIPRIIVPLAVSGLGWAIFNAPNQSAILGAVPHDKIGAASGMIVTTARVGGAMGTALSATLFTYALTMAGLSSVQIESPQSWGSSPEIFFWVFNRTVHIINFFTLFAVFFSAVRGGREG